MVKQTQKKELLRQHRLARYWRLIDLAEQLEVSVSTVQRWEQGIQQPGVYYLGKLCTLFGLSAQELGFMDSPGKPLVAEKETNQLMLASDLQTNVALWTVPFTRNPYFIGRDDLFVHLMQHFSLFPDRADRERVLPPPVALSGLGGIGKTQIALEYAYRVHEQYPESHILWLTAASEETLLTSVIAIAQLLPGYSSDHIVDRQQLVATVRHWLEQQSSPWLLVMDDVNDFALLQSYVPRYGNGWILMTTRANAVGLLAVPLVVHDFLPEEGVHFLLQRTHQRAEDAAEVSVQAQQIVEELALFPLALDQAGAYIEETGCSLDTYLQLYRQHRQHLLARLSCRSSYYPYSVATTWSLAFTYLEQHHPEGILLLQLCAFLAPEHIPEELLTEGAIHWPSRLQVAVTNPITFNQLLEALLAFSLVKRLATKKLLRLHRMVQVVQREQLSPQVQREWAERIIRAIHMLFPQTPKDMRTWVQCQRYLEQIQVCVTLIQQHQLDLPEAGELLDRAGTYCREMGMYYLAETWLQQALQLRQQSMGKEHLITSESLNNLALVYFRQGKYRQAEPLFQQALRIREQQLGQEHLTTAQSLHNLALLYFFQGSYDQVLPLLERAFMLAEQQLGPDHQKTANCLENLARFYTMQGKYEQAESYYQRALTIAEHQFAGGDLALLHVVLTELANLYTILGKNEDAENLYLRAIALYKEAWGVEHPWMAHPLCGLASLYVRQEKYQQAELLFQRALTIWEQEEHPFRARALHGLATLYGRQEKYEQAEALFQQALKIDECQLGQGHLEIATLLSDWADVYAFQQQYEQAWTFYQRAFTIFTQVLGSEHQQTHACWRQIEILQQVMEG